MPAIIDFTRSSIFALLTVPLRNRAIYRAFSNRSTSKSKEEKARKGERKRERERERERKGSPLIMKQERKR